MKYPNFVGGAYRSRSPVVAADEAVNLYYEAAQSGTGKSQAGLYGTPGYLQWASLPTSPVRGIWIGEARCFVVAGSKLYELNASGNPINGRAGRLDMGDVGNDGNPVQMFPNGSQLAIVSAGSFWVDDGVALTKIQFRAYSYDDLAIDAADDTKLASAADPFGPGDVGLQISITAGTGFTVQTITILAVDDAHLATADKDLGDAGSTGGVGATVPDYVTAAQAAYLDGYFVVRRTPDSAQPLTNRMINHSALYDGKIWDPLDYAVKEGYPDALLAVLADHEDLWLVGSQSAEVWRSNYSTDPVAFPWERDPGAFIHYGIVAPWTLCRFLDSVAWLAGDPRGRVCAVAAQGYQPRRISTYALEKEWATYSAVSDAEAYTYTDEGHDFWVINFPTADRTWVYDATATQWHRRSWWDGAAHRRHRGRCHGFCFGKHLIGDWQTGQIYEMSLDYFGDNGTLSHRYRTAPHLADEGKRIFYHAFALDAETGLGLDPTLAVSNDGGRTWGSERNPQNADEVGDNLSRLRWNRLGSSRDRVFRVTVTAAVRVALVDAYLELTEGTH